MGHMRRANEILVLLFLLLSLPAHSEEPRKLSTMGAVAFGSVDEAGYGATGILNVGSDLGPIFGIELQGGLGITEEVGLGPERFYLIDLLIPATLTICSSDSWICPGSTFELVLITGVGMSQFSKRWALNVVAGIALDSFRDVGPFEVGLRAAVEGHYDVLDYERLVVILQLHLGVIFRFARN